MPDEKDQGYEDEEESLDLDSLDIGDEDDDLTDAEAETPEDTSRSTVADEDEDGQTSEIDEELEALRKKARHADKKITEQGQENAAYRQEIQTLTQQIASLQQQVQQQQVQQQANRQTSDYYDDDGYEAPPVSNPNVQDQYREVIPYMASELLELKQQLEQVTQQRERTVVVSAIQEATGLTPDDAEVYLELQNQGDLQGAASFLTKVALRNQQRNAQRRTRDAEAASTVVTGTSAQATGDDGDPFGGVTDPAARRAMLAEDPGLLTRAARAMRRRR